MLTEAKNIHGPPLTARRGKPSYFDKEMANTFRDTQGSQENGCFDYEDLFPTAGPTGEDILVENNYGQFFEKSKGKVEMLNDWGLFEKTFQYQMPTITSKKKEDMTKQ